MFLIALVLVRRRTDTPREKIRSYIFFVFVIGLTAMIPLFWLVGNYVVGHQFKSLERERTETAADRLQELSSSEVQVLTELSLQYSVWDDSYNYVMKQIRNYEAANYQQDVIFDGRLSGAYIFNKNRQFLFCQKYLYAEKQYIPCAEKGKDAQKIQQILETHFQKLITDSKSCPWSLRPASMEPTFTDEICVFVGHFCFLSNKKQKFRPISFFSLLSEVVRGRRSAEGTEF